MTDQLTDEAVTKLANDCVLAANCMEAEDTFPTGQGILREAARALLDARAENARLRADAQAAMAPVAWKYRWKIDGEYVGWRYSDASNAHPSLDGYEEQPLYSADVLVQARADAQAAVALVVERAAEAVNALYEKVCADAPPQMLRRQVIAQLISLNFAIRAEAAAIRGEGK